MSEEQPKDLPPVRITWRFLTAYKTTFAVLGSYLWLNLLSRMMGPSYKEDRIVRLHQKNASRIEESILRLQGLFIKVGQLFSIMTNFLPPEFRSGLKNMQDAVPARPYSQIERRMMEEFGRPPLEVFATFETEPIASASLGQVHSATTKDGRKVAVKVQHIGVEAMSRSDLKTIRRIIQIVRLFLHIRGLDNFYQEIRSMILDELDFNIEAANIEVIARNFSDNPKVFIPRVIPKLSTEKVLTLEYVEGVKITESARLLEAGLDPSQLAKDVVIAYCQMIFVDGVYHADPHPGNILVQPSGRIVFLDFGAVGNLSTNMRQGISSFFEAMIKGDRDQLLKALRTMGFLRTGSDYSGAATRLIENFHRKFQEEISIEEFSLSSIKIDTRKGLDALADVWQIDVGIRELSKEFYIPKEWVLLERTGLLLAGLCTHLDPAMNPAESIRPYLEEFVLGKDRDWSEMLFDLSKEKLLSFLALPGQIDRAIERTLAGKVTFRVDGIQAGAEMLYSAGRQLIYTLLAIASGAFGVYCHETGAADLALYSAYSASGFGILLLLSMIRSRRFRNRH